MIPSKEEMYSALEKRHGSELQKKISESSVAVCGLGGLGSNIAVSLARAGIGRLHLIDFDKVELSNLNRQQYAIRHIGMYKTQALMDVLKEIAPYTEIETDTVKITEENINQLLKDEKIICEAFDNPVAKALLVNSVLEDQPESYIIAASGMAGIGPSNDIHTKKITDHFYLCGDCISQSDDVTGLFSSRAMLCAAHQAHAVLRIIAGKYDV